MMFVYSVTLNKIIIITLYRLQVFAILAPLNLVLGVMSPEFYSVFDKRQQKKMSHYRHNPTSRQEPASNQKRDNKPAWINTGFRLLVSTFRVKSWRIR